MNANDKYWEYNKAEDVHELYYTEYYEPELIATIEDAKEEVEGIIVCNLENKIESLRNYIEHLKEVLKDFEGGE